MFLFIKSLFDDLILFIVIIGLFIGAILAAFIVQPWFWLAVIAITLIFNYGGGI